MRWQWLPNAISILRILLVPPILWLIISDRFTPALLLFLLAGFSDGIDGWLAKRNNWHTRLGALLDPVADKLLIGTVFLLLIIENLIPLWLGALVILRDVVIIGGATAYNFLVRPLDAEPTRISKLNTAVELLLVVFILARAAFDWPPAISVTVLGAAVFVTVMVSGIDYVWSWSRRLRQAKNLEQA